VKAARDADRWNRSIRPRESDAGDAKPTVIVAPALAPPPKTAGFVSPSAGPHGASLNPFLEPADSAAPVPDATSCKRRR